MDMISGLRYAAAQKKAREEAEAAAAAAAVASTGSAGGAMLDPDRYEWVEISGRPDSPYRIHHELSVLGYDKAAGTIDLLIRFDDKGGHCQAHRHLTTTTVLVLQGEQHLDEMRPGGEVVHKVRRTGEYHLTTGDPYPHRERGGPEGGVLFFSHHTSDGRLYEIVDDDNRPIHTVTIDSLIETWQSRTTR